MLLCKTIDLDVEKISDVLKNARKTIEYLQNVVLAIETRALDGEKMENIQIVDGQRKRIITEQGLNYLTKVFGEEKVYKTIVKPIGIGDLEKMISPEEIGALTGKGVIGYELGKKKVIVVEYDF
jgi:hypothetical protein